MAAAIACLGRGLRGYESEQDVYARVKKAVHLFKLKNPDYLILSGGYTTSTKFSEAKFMEQFALDMGVPKDRIILEEHSKNTVENAVYISELASSRNIDSLTIVTSPYHLLRTKIIFTRIIRGRALDFFASSYPFHPSLLLIHYLSESIRLLRITLFGIRLPKKKNADANGHRK